MTPLELENRAQEARNVLDNETIAAALDAMRHEAVERLVTANATDTEAIRDNQALVRAIDQFRDELGAMILSKPRVHPTVT